MIMDQIKMDLLEVVKLKSQLIQVVAMDGASLYSQERTRLRTKQSIRAIQ